MNQFVVFSKGLFLLMAASLLAALTYLAVINPDINSREQARIQAEEQLAAETELEELQEWVHRDWSDVDTDNEKYPIVVLRDGFKVLRIDADSALVGWRYELINTSSKQSYTAEVRYTIQDQDGFDVVEGRGSLLVQPEKYGEISGTLIVTREDVRRLAGSDWAIWLNPDWQSLEAKTEGTRYERLTRILKGDISLPAWVRERARDEDAAFLRVFSDKWKAIAAAYSASGESSSESERN